jgi:predicted lipoprotein
MRFFERSVIALALAAAPGCAIGAPADMARRFADEFAIPRFQAVASASHAQAGAWKTFCGNPRRGKIESLKQAYQNLSDAWSDVEFVRIGPAAVALRVERFNWWLDRTDATGKAMTAMISAKPEDLTVEKLATGSVAGQGLPIVERLLFPVSEASALKGRDGAQRCLVGAAVTQEQAAIADQIVGDWTSPDGARAALVANKSWKVSFADANEAASVMMTDLVAGLEGLKDLKVAMEFHDVMNPKAPRLAEAPRSGLTLRDIERNLTAIRQGLAIFLVQATPAQRTQLDAAFDDAERAIKEIESAKDEAARTAAVKESLPIFSTLSQAAMTILPQATGLTLGFNNLDGD